jgi:hypothetical protein
MDLSQTETSSAPGSTYLNFLAGAYAFEPIFLRLIPFLVIVKSSINIKAL